MHKKYFLFVILMVMMFQVEAGITTFKGGTTANTDFDSAITSFGGLSTNILNFDTLTGGSAITEGSTLDGLTFNSNLPSQYQMGVKDTGSISGLNSLAVIDTNSGGFLNFGLSDKIDIDFAATNAFGFWLITSTNFTLLNNDVNVTFGGTTLSILTGDQAQDFGSFSALWLGFFDDMATHTSATIQFGNLGDNFVSIGELDDITTTSVATVGQVAEPAIILLFGIGLLGLFGFSYRRF